MSESESMPAPARAYLTDARDEELVSRSRTGDQEAFEALVLRHRARLTRVAQRFLSGLSEAEDMVQEAFVKAFTRLDRLRDGVPFRNWATRIVINLCIDELRRRKRHREAPMPETDMGEAEWIDRQLSRQSVLADRQAVESREARALLNRVEKVLGPKERVILHLLYGEEMTAAEVAELVGWTEVNVRVRAFRARRLLKRELEKLMNPG